MQIERIDAPETEIAQFLQSVNDEIMSNYSYYDADAIICALEAY